MMNYIIRLSLLTILILVWRISFTQEINDSEFAIPYGNNDSVGTYIDINGIKMYYEEYGKGEPLFLIHENGGSIESMSYQIERFKKNFRVIAADSRGHGKSELNTDTLTYNQMAQDWVDLAIQLKLDSVYVI